MKTIQYTSNALRTLLAFVCILFVGNVHAQQLAFPTAEGYGRYTTGGRGGKLYIVTNLNDAGTGSLREAMEASGKRIVVFRVSGIIRLQSDINVKNGDLSIFGQTAPGDGICTANYTVQLSASNIIIRYMRFRPGSYQTGEYDASWGRNNSNIILDHNSYSWGNDEQASFYDNTNFTMQYCLITESFYSSTHPKGNHGFGAIWGGMGATFHHNLMANHTSRMPRFCGARYHLTTASTEIVDFRNNVIYNWGYNSSYGGEAGNQNMVNNYYKPGPATGTGSVKYRIINPSDAKADGNPISKWYVSGNYMYGNTSVTSNNWSTGVQPDDGTITLTELKLNSALPSAGIVTQTAADAYTKVLATAGASLKRDAVDTRAVNGVTSGTSNVGGVYGANTGIIDNESQVGGYPTYASTTPPTDTDNDGMPNSWEIAHGLSTTVADQNADRDGDGYTNIEEYVGCLVGEFTTCDPTADCNGVANGSAKLDVCGRCIAGTTGKTACTSVGEAETDACTFDGVAETKNMGYKGASYLNVDNAVGTSITFNVSATNAGTATLSFRYANGGTVDRPAQISLNGAVLPNNLSFPVTGTFTDWKAVDVSLTLLKGSNTVKLLSTTAEGLPNIDQIGYVSTGVSKGSCVITGLEESNEAQFVSIYPNPSKVTFHLNVSKATDFQIIDMEGRLCEEHRNISNVEFGENLKSGIYFLKIENKVYKLVKE
jgi:hypothetical protein